MIYCLIWAKVNTLSLSGLTLVMAGNDVVGNPQAARALLLSHRFPNRKTF